MREASQWHHVRICCADRMELTPRCGARVTRAFMIIGRYRTKGVKGIVSHHQNGELCTEPYPFRAWSGALRAPCRVVETTRDDTAVV